MQAETLMDAEREAILQKLVAMSFITKITFRVTVISGDAETAVIYSDWQRLMLKFII